MTIRTLLFFLILVFYAAVYQGCVSKTSPEDRYNDSLTMTAPLLVGGPADPNNFTFAIVGDLHIGGQDTSRLQRILTAATAETDSCVIFLGDIVDQGERADFTAFSNALVGAWSNKTFSVIGNHDVFFDGWSAFKQVINIPSNYTFTVGNSKFIVLDTADGTLGSGQTRWLNTEISKPHTTFTNLFLMSHYLPFIPGQRTYLKFADDVEGKRLMKLASKNGVTGWLGAHYHSYIVGNSEGVSYVVAGGGGGQRMDPVQNFFFVQVRISNGTNVTYTMVPVS